ncbi:MAG TPA: prepilin-type N-terminal cleavage/methylation domain-containing protein [Candidatus Krumholzibacteria bacterium]|nr:prepilin-type N-terminal cleavage/methylation domain-containing protein [Candidatus Krumholzibacteria bacterium]HPD72999.1 prepilin-type N-terminal cleavage/methylation domain-containing protein [Candidatus Krumholzibacteria bacterium]HRY41798.1 prepilin-type N-terminal cleavage/methylation domain-containing protein [Candidatus Krumholzibacteria bacterium]
MMRAIDRDRRRPGAGRISREGFTLVEVLVVLVILAIGIMPLAVVQTRARQEVAEADRFTQAVTLAQRQLEWCKGMGFAAAAADSGVDGSLRWWTDVEDVDVGLRRLWVTVVFQQGATPDTLRMASLLSIR